MENKTEKRIFVNISDFISSESERHGNEIYLRLNVLIDAMSWRDVGDSKGAVLREFNGTDF